MEIWWYQFIIRPLYSPHNIHQSTRTAKNIINFKTVQCNFKLRPLSQGSPKWYGYILGGGGSTQTTGTQKESIKIRFYFLTLYMLFFVYFSLSTQHFRILVHLFHAHTHTERHIHMRCMLKMFQWMTHNQCTKATALIKNPPNFSVTLKFLVHRNFGAFTRPKRPLTTWLS